MVSARRAGSRPATTVRPTRTTWRSAAAPRQSQWTPLPRPDRTLSSAVDIVEARELVQERRPAGSSLRRRDHPQGPRRRARGRGWRPVARRQTFDHRPAEQSPDSARALGRSTRLSGHESAACRRPPDGTVPGVRRALLAVARAIKIVLVAALLRDKIWAYPWMIAFLIV